MNTQAILIATLVFLLTSALLLLLVRRRQRPALSALEIVQPPRRNYGAVACVPIIVGLVMLCMLSCLIPITLINNDDIAFAESAPPIRAVTPALAGQKVLVEGAISPQNPVSAQGLVAFTLTVFKDVFSKEYEATAAQLPYFLAPTAVSHAFDFSSVTDPSCVVDWPTVMFVRDNERIAYTFNEPDDFFKDKYVADPYDGSRKFFIRGRRHNLKPTDPVPEGIVAPSHRAWKVGCKTHDILNYSLSAWAKSRTLIVLREDQPVVEAEVLPIRRNLLDDNIGDDDLEPKPCFIILQPLRISPVSQASLNRRVAVLTDTVAG